MTKRTVAILIYDDVEVLDLAGPFEVFAVASELNDWAPFDVYTVAEREGPVRAVNGLRVIADYALDDAPKPDVLVVPGGAGSRRAMDEEAIVTWVRQSADQAEVVLCVCSGARILARAGLLDGLPVATHHLVEDHLRELAPAADVRTGERVIDTGRIVTTGGISAGIDGSFHVVARLLGDAAARATAEYMEYAWAATGDV